MEIRILLVEDDPHLGAALRTSLRQAGMDLEWAKTVEDGRLHLDTLHCDLLLLDLGLPDGCGLALLRELRRSLRNLPVIILTARDGVENRILGLEEGADDYLVKPFAIPELVSRIRAVYRRSAGFAGRTWVLGDLSLDPDQSLVRVRGQAVELSPREHKLLFLLARSAGRVLPRANLEECLYDMGGEPESNALEVHIHRLRKKLGARRIRTIRGIGYLLEEA
jgi:DNA-binding response OmpR family regulator